MNHKNDLAWIAAFKLTEAATAVSLLSEREQSALFARALQIVSRAIEAERSRHRLSCPSEN